MKIDRFNPEIAYYGVGDPCAVMDMVGNGEYVEFSEYGDLLDKYMELCEKVAEIYRGI